MKATKKTHKATKAAKTHKATKATNAAKATSKAKVRQGPRKKMSMNDIIRICCAYSRCVDGCRRHVDLKVGWKRELAEEKVRSAEEKVRSAAKKKEEGESALAEREVRLAANKRDKEFDDAKTNLERVNAYARWSRVSQKALNSRVRFFRIR